MSGPGNDRRRGPVVIEEDDTGPGPRPADAPPVPEDTPPGPEGQAMRSMAALTARPASTLSRWFWRSAAALLVFVVSLTAWDTLTGLLETRPALGAVAVVLVAAVFGLALMLVLREWAALSRLARIDEIRRAADAALASKEVDAARKVAERLTALYSGRDELRWGRDRLAARGPEQFDADAVISLAEAELLIPLDDRARIEVEAAARQVAAVTALVPLALADVAAALVANLRMIRRIAEIYGGRGGVLGAWRLTRAVMTHLVATGAVAVGDDLIGSVAGGSVLSRVSRRFGEGIVNGALTARVGVAAIEVCRPLPFSVGRRPSTSGIVRRALTGLFGTERG